ncbi:MAG: 2Fe-2S iron-sulfur cluster-binding protein [Nitrospiria bacterium]
MVAHTDVDPSPVTIRLDGASHSVPKGITVIQAAWRLGRPMIRGVGCLGGVCGACPITVRLPNRFESQTALACQTLVEDGMSITFLPPDQSKKEIAPVYSEGSAEVSNIKRLIQYYPETRRCVACQACTTICPQGIDVMGGVRAAVNGDLEAVAEKFISCVMCGLCAMVCDVRIRPHRVGTYARRLSGAFYPKEATHLLKRIDEIGSGRYDEEWKEVLSS